jgi:hypothetical protein
VSSVEKTVFLTVIFMQLEELEGRLFGGATANLKNFGKEEEEHAARLPSKYHQVDANYC